MNFCFSVILSPADSRVCRRRAVRGEVSMRELTSVRELNNKRAPQDVHFACMMSHMASYIVYTQAHVTHSTHAHVITPHTPHT